MSKNIVKAHTRDIAIERFQESFPDRSIISISKRFRMRGKYYYRIKSESKNKKWKIHVKAIYDSPRGSGHDFFYEGYLEIVSREEPTPEQIEEKIKEMISSGEFSTNTNFKDFYDKIESDDYSYEIGIEESEPIEESEEIQTILEVFKIGYNIKN